MNLNRLKKDCFWDSGFSVKDIERIAKSGGLKEKLYLFEKILLNSTNLFGDLNIFPKEDIEKLLSIYKIPGFKKEYIEKRKNLIEAYFFDKPLTVEELKWIV